MKKEFVVFNLCVGGEVGETEISETDLFSSDYRDAVFRSVFGSYPNRFFIKI